MTALAIPLHENLAQGPEVIAVGGETFTTTVKRQLPFFVSRNQLYYWTRDWQAGEQEALADLAKGRVRVFRDGASASEWLLMDDDED